MKEKFTVIAAALFMLAACQAEPQIEESPISETPVEEAAQPNVVKEGVVPPEVTASLEIGAPTKSLIEVDGEGVGTIYWTPSDEINVFYGTTSTRYISKNTENATTAVFKTLDVIGTTESASENIWGLYPYNENASCTGSAVTTTLPANQKGVPGTFDDDLYITLAHNTSTALVFWNVCGGIKFSLSRNDITSITFRGNNNEDIAGDISLTFDGETNLPVATVLNGAKEITLTPKTGTTFASGENYYIILLPGTLSSGFTMTFDSTDGTTGTFNYTANAVTIKRSVFSKKANIDTYAIFDLSDNCIVYTSIDGKMISPYQYYDSDDDILYGDFGANIVSNQYSDGKGIIRFDGPVTRIGRQAFSRRYNLKSIVIPKTVTSIDHMAFNQCYNLEEIESKSEVAPYVTTTTFSKVGRCGRLIYPSGASYNSWLSTNNNMLGAFEWNEIRPLLTNSITSDNEIWYVTESASEATFNTNLSDLIRDPTETNQLILSIDDHIFYAPRYGGVCRSGSIRFSNNSNTTGQILKNADVLAVGMSDHFSTMDIESQEGFHISIPAYYYGSKVERVNINDEGGWGASLSYNKTIGNKNYAQLGTLVINDCLSNRSSDRRKNHVTGRFVDYLDIDRVFCFAPDGSPFSTNNTNRTMTVIDDMTIYYRRPEGWSKEDFESYDWSSSWWGDTSNPASYLSPNIRVTIKMLPDDLDKANLRSNQNYFEGYYIIAKAGDTMHVKSSWGDEDHYSDVEGYIGSIGENKWIERYGDYIELEGNYTFNEDYEGWISFASTSTGGFVELPTGVIVLGASNTDIYGVHTAFAYQDGILKQLTAKDVNY